jgi:hypothetical protein
MASWRLGIREELLVLAELETSTKRISSFYCTDSEVPRTKTGDV